ncbi:MAG TPA: prepilin-type cleavage/methylation domain-containing protein [Xanthomonadaceae bacterium]|jgi:MSHA pilin protein MshA|nr:prepilin-type cleavage/methylation domain-containing protein [Xanthomonadaceae bacterium]
MKHQSGFTLIELVIVIVLLGVLAAIAVPRFVNLEDDAQEARLNATAAAITSAMNINYAECAVNNFTGADCRPVTSCDAANATAVLQNGAAALAGYTVAFQSGSSIPAGNGSVATCTLTRAGVGTANFTAIRTAP